jgi:hypothetical protein
MRVYHYAQSIQVINKFDESKITSIAFALPNENGIKVFTIPNEQGVAATKEHVNNLLLDKADKTNYYTLLADRSLLNATGLQKIFDNPTNNGDGAFTALANRKYKFYIQAVINGLSASAQSLRAGFLGTASISHIGYISNSIKTTDISLPLGAVTSSKSMQTSVVITTSNSGTQSIVNLEVTVFTGVTAGTIIPCIDTSIASSTGVVKKGATWIVEDLGAISDYKNGNFS